MNSKTSDLAGGASNPVSSTSRVETGTSGDAWYSGVSEVLAQARGLPGEHYSNPQVFDAEVDKVFRAGWIPVARVSAVARPGDFMPVDVAGQPLLVTRDMAGEVHVLSRVCRHRGMILTEGAGNARSLTCPYHLWRYELNGALLAAPAMEAGQVSGPAPALKSYRCESWCGWIFVNISGDAHPLGPDLARLSERLSAYNPAAMVTTSILSFDSPWNWKVMVENFLESYHHIGPHSTSLQRSNPGLGTYPGEHCAAFTILENPPAGPDSGAFLVAAVFPLGLMFFSLGGPGGEPTGGWYEITGVEPQALKLRIHLLAPPALAAQPEFVENFAALVTSIHLEDIPVCEGVQKGVTSRGYEPGPLSALEGCLWHFHKHLQRCFQ